MFRAERIVRELFSQADIEINGSRPWDIQLHNPQFYHYILQKKVLGFGESYMAGWWDCAALDECVARLYKAHTEENFKIRPLLWLKIAAHRLVNFQTKERAGIVGQRHYDFGNDLFSVMLDKNLVYSCGYWKNATNLDEAQEAKLDLVCKKLYLKPGMHLLDIGCGWGSLAKFAAEHYGVKVTGITISKEQVELARKRCEGLPVTILLQDYRELKGKYDAVASIGMLEHVGYKNYRNLMQIVKNNLTSEGLFLLHTMGSHYTVFNNNDWLEKYIFPNGMLPSIKQLGASWEKIFFMEDWHNFGTYYYPTLKSWHHNFNAGWEELKSNYNTQFQRMWEFYLLSCAGSAMARAFQVWQIVLSNNLGNNYQSVR